MTDATDARIAKSIENMDRTLRSLVRIMETMNENLAETGKILKNWLDDTNSLNDKIEKIGMENLTVPRDDVHQIKASGYDIVREAISKRDESDE
jgi:hypothetical protein